MFTLARTIRNEDDEVVTLTIIFDQDGMSISKAVGTKLPESVQYTLLEADVICELVYLIQMSAKNNASQTLS